MNELANDAEEPFPEPVTVRIGEKTYTLHSLTVTALGAMNRALVPTIAMLSHDDRLLEMVDGRSADLMPVVAASSGLDVAVLRAMDGASFIKLFAAALEVNREFFASCFSMRFGSIGAKLQQMMDIPGLLPSTTSATVATAATAATSSATDAPQPASVAS